MEAGPFETVLPVTIVQLSANLRIHDARVRAILHDDGSMQITMGGGVETSQLFTLVDQSGEAKVEDVANLVIDALADLGCTEQADGTQKCLQMSMTLVAQSTAAFLY